MIDEAKVYSDRVVAQAQGDAERFKEVYAQYSKAPAVIRDRMYLETMQQIYSNTTKVFVDSKSGSNVLYLPLDKLVEQTRQRTAEAAAAGSAPAAQGGRGAASAQGQANAQGAQGAQPAAQGGNTPTIITPPAAPVSSASQAAAASDAFRSRDSFRSRGREDDLQ